MKEIRNYKNIRRKPQIHGFTPNGAYIFIGLFIASILMFVNGLSFKKVMIFLVFNAINYIITKLIISNDKLLKKLFDEKFPQEISHLTRKVKVKK